MKKTYIKTAGFIIAFMGLYVALQAAYISMVTFIGGIIMAVKTPEIFQSPNYHDTVMRFVSFQTLIALLVSGILAFPIYYLVCKYRGENIFEVCRFNKLLIKQGLLLIPAGLTLYFTNVLMLSILNSTGLMDRAFTEHGDLMASITNGPLPLVLIGVGIVVPIIEEVMFRGLIFNELRKVTSLKWTILLQAILFGVFHMQLLQGIYATLIGLFLALVYVWFDSIWAPIVIHMIINSTSLILSRTPVGGVMYRFETPIYIISIVGGIISFIVIYKNRRINDHQLIEANNIGTDSISI